MPINTPVVANDRIYPAPKTCAIAICLDGCEPEYLEVAIAEGLMPTLKRIRETGTDRTGAFGDPLLHQPQQHEHRDRPSAHRYMASAATSCMSRKPVKR